MHLWFCHHVSSEIPNGMDIKFNVWLKIHPHRLLVPVVPMSSAETLWVNMHELSTSPIVSDERRKIHIILLRKSIYTHSHTVYWTHCKFPNGDRFVLNKHNICNGNPSSCAWMRWQLFTVQCSNGNNYSFWTVAFWTFTNELNGKHRILATHASTISHRIQHIMCARAHTVCLPPTPQARSVCAREKL